MNNISNRQHSKLRFKLSKKKQYDFQLSDSVSQTDGGFDPLINLQPTNSGTVLENTVEWGDAVMGDLSSVSHFGLTALDNGLLSYTGSYEDTISSTPTLTRKFTLKKVDGYSEDLDIDYSVSESNGEISLQGGFYQGFYKLDGYDYQVLPERYEKGWTLSVDLMREPELSGTTSLNYYASQKGYDTNGFFFYTGTRAENKYWNQFEPENHTGATEASYDGIMVQTTNEEVIIPLPPPRVVIKRMDNQFLIYGRGSGRKVCSDENTFTFGSHMAHELDKDDFENGEVHITYSGRTTFDKVEDINSFLKYGRGSGKPPCGDESDHVDAVVNGVEYDYGTAMARDDKSNDNMELELNIHEDLPDNALGFRITPSGEVSYRRFVKRDECVHDETFNGPEDFVILEETTEGLNLPQLEWFNITLKWESTQPYDCSTDEPRMGKLYLYIDGNLKWVFNDFAEIMNKPLNEYKDKQLGVPYTISIGGGTQGLLENMTFGGTDLADREQYLERNFAGTFIGKLKNFKLYDQPLNWCEIKNIINVND